MGTTIMQDYPEKITSKMNITSGIDVNILYNKYNTVHTYLQAHTHNDTITGYSTNPISGNRKAIVGDAIVMDTVIRTIVDYNRHEVISIPLILEYNIFNQRGWNIGIGLGSSISFLRSYSGVQWMDNDLAKYDQTSGIYNTSTQWAIQSSASVNKNLFGDFYLGLRLDYKHHFNNWSLQT